MIILHILQNSLPKISGSTIRTKYIFKYQKEYLKIVALTSYLFEESDKDIEFIDGILHYRINKRIRRLLIKIQRILSRMSIFFLSYLNIQLDNKIQDIIISFFMKFYIKRLVNYYNVDIIHGHSHHQAVKYGLRVAKKRKIPFIYEVRGFLEENLIAKNKKFEFTNKKIKNKYYSIKKGETDLMKKADMIITLSDPMKDEIITRGILEEKIRVIPNGTDVSQMKPIDVNYVLKEKLGLNGKTIIGFIGRITWYEGIEYLLKSIPILLKQRKDIQIILIGSIERDYLEYLDNIINNLNISDNVQFIGNIPHKDIKDYYSIIDFIVLPRVNIKVCRLVTPLKHLEAMVFKKLVIASDLPAFRYTITQNKNGVLFIPEDSSDLASKISYYLENLNEKHQIEENARNFVINNYNWEKIVLAYKRVYEDLLSKK